MRLFRKSASIQLRRCLECISFADCLLQFTSQWFCWPMCRLNVRRLNYVEAWFKLCRPWLWQSAWVRLQLKCDGTRWRTGGEVRGNLTNGVGSQYSSHYLGTWCIQHYYRWFRTPRQSVVDWTDAHADLIWTLSFRRKTKSGFCACAITFQLAPTAADFARRHSLCT